MDLSQDDVIPGRFFIITVLANKDAPQTAGMPPYQSAGFYCSEASAYRDYAALTGMLSNTMTPSFIVLGNKSVTGNTIQSVVIRNEETWLSRITIDCIDRNGETLH